MWKSGLIAGVLLFALVLNSADATDYYVDVDSIGGPSDDNGPGAKEKPWKTLGRAFGSNTPAPQAGDTVYVRGGVYKEKAVIMRGGAADKPLVIKAYSGEKPVIDGEGKCDGIALPGASIGWSTGVLAPTTGAADYVVIDGIIVTNTVSAIKVVGRKGVVIQNVEVVNFTGMGVYFNSSTECKLLKSHVHHGRNLRHPHDEKIHVFDVSAVEFVVHHTHTQK